MTLDFKTKAPEPLTFKDVPINTFYKDHQGDLMLKIDRENAVRISNPQGNMDARLYQPCYYTGVKEIYKVDKINF